MLQICLLNSAACLSAPPLPTQCQKCGQAATCDNGIGSLGWVVLAHLIKITLTKIVTYQNLEGSRASLFPVQHCEVLALASSTLAKNILLSRVFCLWTDEAVQNKLNWGLESIWGEGVSEIIPGLPSLSSRCFHLIVLCLLQ